MRTWAGGAWLVARGRQDPRGAGTRAWLLHVEHDGMAAACCCWIGGSLSRASTVLPPPAGLPTRWMRARRHACVCQRDAVDGWAIIWGVAVRSDLCLFLSLCNCVGVVGGASERIMADGDAPADVTTAGSDRSPAEDAPVRADLSICLTLRARMHGLACLPDWPAGPVWLPQRQCRAVRSAIVLLVNDRSILRPAGRCGVHACYPASTCLLLHHTFNTTRYVGLIPSVPMQPCLLLFHFLRLCVGV